MFYLIRIAFRAFCEELGLCKKPQAKNPDATPSSVGATEQPDEGQPNKSTEIQVHPDKVLFQRNTLHVRNSLEYPANRMLSPISNEAEIPLDPGMPRPQTGTITLVLNEQAYNHILGLCQFFEISQTEVFARGIWLLALARDVELANKKIGVVTTDHNSLIVDVSPINIV